MNNKSCAQSKKSLFRSYLLIALVILLGAMIIQGCGGGGGGGGSDSGGVAPTSDPTNTGTITPTSSPTPTSTLPTPVISSVPIDEQEEIEDAIQKIEDIRNQYKKPINLSENPCQQAVDYANSFDIVSNATLSSDQSTIQITFTNGYQTYLLFTPETIDSDQKRDKTISSIEYRKAILEVASSNKQANKKVLIWAPFHNKKQDNGQLNVCHWNEAYEYKQFFENKGYEVDFYDTILTRNSFTIIRDFDFK